VRYRLDVHITAPARSQLQRFVDREQSYDAIPTIVWTTDTGSGSGGWAVGFYDRNKIPDDFVVDADGIELVVEHQWREALNGACLEVIGGYLSVQGGKPGSA
jgi:hypothetical protein